MALFIAGVVAAAGAIGTLVAGKVANRKAKGKKAERAVTDTNQGVPTLNHTTERHGGNALHYGGTTRRASNLRKTFRYETGELNIPRVSTLVDDGTGQLMPRVSTLVDDGTGQQLMVRANSRFADTMDDEDTGQFITRTSGFVNTVDELGTKHLTMRASEMSMTVDRSTGKVLGRVWQKVELTEPVAQSVTRHRLSLSNLIDSGKSLLDMIPPANRLMPVKLVIILWLLGIFAIQLGPAMIDSSILNTFYLLMKWLSCKLDESTCPEEYHDNKVIEMNERLHNLETALGFYKFFVLLVVFCSVLFVAVLLKFMLIYAERRMKKALENKPESLFVCNICCTAPMDFVYLPCYHMYSCVRCMQRDPEERPVCPVCNIRSKKTKKLNICTERIYYHTAPNQNSAN